MNENNEIARKSAALNHSIRERLSRPTLTEEVKAQNEQTSERKMSWLTEIKHNWFMYFLLGLSATFTGMLGIFMGLAPHLTTDPQNPAAQVIAFNTDFGHVSIAVLYCIAFITITEGAFIAGKWKFHTREENNGAQTVTMIFVLTLAFISILVTGYAGGSVVASTIGFLTEFKEIPAWAQDWAVRIIPVLFGLYTVAFVIYWLSSTKAQNDRIAKQAKQRQLDEHRLQMDMIEMQLEEELLLEEAEMYQRLVREGKLTVSQVRAARRAKKSLPELEQELGRDLDGDNQIGSHAVLQAPSRPTPAPILDSVWECQNCHNFNRSDGRFCSSCGASKAQPEPVNRNGNFH